MNPQIAELLENMKVLEAQLEAELAQQRVCLQRRSLAHGNSWMPLLIQGRARPWHDEIARVIQFDRTSR